MKLPRGKCANCGKEIPVPSTRGKGGYFCSRTCASMKNFKKRYQGTMSGPLDKPDFNEKMGRKA
jgi:hypothetical protein